MLNKRRIVTVVLLVGVLLAFSSVIGHLSSSTIVVTKNQPAAENVVAVSAAPIIVDNPYAIADIAEMASPATVFLSVVWPEVERQVPSQRFTDPFFNFFFDSWFLDPFTSRQPVTPRSAGSGFIIDESGISHQPARSGNKGENQTIKSSWTYRVLIKYRSEIIGSDYAWTAVCASLARIMRLPTVPRRF